MWVPPLSVMSIAVFANNKGGKMVCSTSITLPAVPIAKLYDPPEMLVFRASGVKCSSVEPIAAPITLAFEIAAAASTHVKC